MLLQLVASQMQGEAPTQLHGLKTIDFESHSIGLSASQIASAKQAYASFMNSLIATASTSWGQSGKTKEALIALVGSITSAIWKYFEPAETYLFTESFLPCGGQKPKADCDSSAMIVAHILANLAIPCTLISLPAHVVLKAGTPATGSIYFETTTGKNGTNDLVFYSGELEFNSKYPQNKQFGEYGIETPSLLDYSHRARSYMNQGKFELAVSDLSEAIALYARQNPQNPATPKLFYPRAVAYANLGKYKEASSDLQAAQNELLRRDLGIPVEMFILEYSIKKGLAK